MPPNVTPLMPPRISANQYGRNGQIVAPYAINALAEGANFALRYRPRELAAFGGQLQGIVAASAVLYRGYTRTSPWCAGIRWSMLIAKSPEDDDPSATISLHDSGGFQIGTATAHYGSQSGTPDVVPSEWELHEGEFTYLPDQDLEVRITTANTCRVIDALAWETTNAVDASGGYFDLVGNTQQIYDSQRDAMAAAVEDMLTAGGAHVLHWYGPRTAAVITPTNIIDDASTAVTTATPGFTLDLRYKARKSQTTGVPCKLRAYGVAVGGADGTLTLRDSTGTALATLGPFATVAGWLSADVVLPASVAKYDLWLSRTTRVTTLHAVSLLELD